LRRSYRDLPATYGLLAVLAAIFLFEGGIAGDPSVGRLVQLGAQVNQFVLAGAWWRIVTAMFLHFSWTHFLLNAWSLFVMGELVEPALGTRTYLIVYLASGVMGGLMSLALYPQNQVLAGASGAIFGLLGATAVLAWQARGPVRSSLLRWVVGILVLNLGFDFLYPGIGVWDHVGGLSGGVLATWVIIDAYRGGGRSRYAGALLYVLCGAALVYMAYHA